MLILSWPRLPQWWLDMIPTLDSTMEQPWQCISRQRWPIHLEIHMPAWVAMGNRPTWWAMNINRLPIPTLDSKWLISIQAPTQCPLMRCPIRWWQQPMWVPPSLMWDHKPQWLKAMDQLPTLSTRHQMSIPFSRLFRPHQPQEWAASLAHQPPSTPLQMMWQKSQQVRWRNLYSQNLLKQITVWWLLLLRIWKLVLSTWWNSWTSQKCELALWILILQSLPTLRQCPWLGRR